MGASASSFRRRRHATVAPLATLGGSNYSPSSSSYYYLFSLRRRLLPRLFRLRRRHVLILLALCVASSTVLTFVLLLRAESTSVVTGRSVVDTFVGALPSPLASILPTFSAGDKDGREEFRVVVASDGLTVRRDVKLNSDVVGTVPFGGLVAIRAGKSYSTWAASADSSGRRMGGSGKSYARRVQITFPYRGWITSGEEEGGRRGDVSGSRRGSPGQYLRRVSMNGGRNATRRYGGEEDVNNPLKCCASPPRVVGESGEYEPLPWSDFRSGAFPSYPPGVSNSPWTFTLRRDASSTDWLGQVPIGSGRTGTLVGGTAGVTIMPVSTAGLFVGGGGGKAEKSNLSMAELFQKSRSALLEGDIDGAAKAVADMSGMSAGQHPLATFHYAADFTLAFSPVGVGIQNQTSDGGPSLIQSLLKQYQNVQKLRAKAKRGFRPPPLPNIDVPKGVDTGSRRGAVILSLLGMMDRLSDRSRNATQFVPVLGMTHLSDFNLDMRTGVFRETHVVVAAPASAIAAGEGGKGRGGSGTHLHHREWYATHMKQESGPDGGSTDGHVVAGRLKCKRWGRGYDGGGEGCLNFGAMISRENGGGGLKFDVEAEELVRGAKHDSHISPLSEAGSRRDASLGLLSSRRAALHLHLGPDPSVHVCAVVICRRDKEGAGDRGVRLEARTNPDGGGAALSCSGADSADVFLSVSMESPRGRDVPTSMRGGSGDGDVRERLRKRCEETLARALERGYEGLREDKAEGFGADMARMDVRLGDDGSAARGGAASAMCDGHSLEDRMKHPEPQCRGTAADGSDGADDVADSQRGLSKGDAGTLTASFAGWSFRYSRYLLLSSMSHAVPNLQGIWTDGPTSAWSGDYHLNINLQMMYWGTGPAALGPASHGPLWPFVKELANGGKAAAADLYGCSAGGWTAHGFTDHTLKGHLRGEPHWALCATCGLWTALHLFENLLFSNPNEWVNGAGGDGSNRLLDTLSVLRDSVAFFREYTFVDPRDGVRHTGPATSPENSYAVFTRVPSLPSPAAPGGITEPPEENVTTVASALHLAFSPAIDASLLRQLCNAFPLLASWARRYSTEDDYGPGLREIDVALAEELRRMVQEMPFGGRPAVGRRTGRVLEYPMPLGAAAEHLDDISSMAPGIGANGTAAVRRTVTEELDPGHRHWSSMHWLYPNTFVPTAGGGKGEADAVRYANDLLAAAQKTVDHKRTHGGGHTSWSASWESCLRARLRDGAGAWDALSRVARRYAGRNGLSFHPPLKSVPDADLALPSEHRKLAKGRGCGTCYTEGKGAARGSDFGAAAARGMETGRSDKFQLDGHGGTVAALTEMLLMSHVPGHLFVLPSVSSLPREATSPGGGGGAAFGMRARGDVGVSVTWVGRGEDTAVSTLELAFEANHPWLDGSHWAETAGYWEESGGMGDSGDKGRSFDRPALLTLHSPGGRGLTSDKNTCSRQLDEDAFLKLQRSQRKGGHGQILPIVLTKDMDPVLLHIQSFPCTLYLCAQGGGRGDAPSGVCQSKHLQQRDALQHIPLG